jgi:hypothetical protein
MFALDITGIKKQENYKAKYSTIHVLLVSKTFFSFKKIHSPANYQFQSPLCLFILNLKKHRFCQGFLFKNIYLWRYMYTGTSVTDPGYLSRIRIFPFPDPNFSIPDPNFFHPGSASKNLSILTQKNCLYALGNMIWVVHPGSGSRIWILTLYPSGIPDPGVKKAPDPEVKKAPDPQH